MLQRHNFDLVSLSGWKEGEQSDYFVRYNPSIGHTCYMWSQINATKQKKERKNGIF